MAAIKRFFEKKKLDVKFKKAGEGHSLNETSARKPVSKSTGLSNPRRTGPAETGQRAAEAALSRLQSTHDQEIIQDSAPVLSTIFYKCPEIGEAVLSKCEMDEYIHEFLLTNLAEEPEMTSALMIQTLNKDREKVGKCVETLTKYIDNVINNPDDHKYRKIRVNNKAFQDRVACLKGTEEFLQAVRFEMKLLPHEDNEEYFYVLEDEAAMDIERLKGIKEVLTMAKPIKPQLDRSLKVFHPSSGASKFYIPDEFYAISPEEIKKEQQCRTEAVEKLGMLRTKAMRERDEQRELRKYRFTLLRIRLPEGIILQGTFRAMEKLKTLYDYVRENLINDWMPFQLISSSGEKLIDEDLTLAELGLVPATVVNFAWDLTVAAEVAAQQGSSATTNCLKPEIAALIQDL
ncbi:hypothetical protein LOTGIDRAFT_158366 [Lottia gigantea]|uniref:UBX domain-containing protein n=1 Tax=Lottia gigantea TaxID=225164 RepID=V4AZV8_LOTGI|nr:hypothetical protein LOTGIDRAFT_158366 [Lottia gigantea]ESO99286.1 hypothetical protein LOTGIDRAFT_158366 [Lottia gigantea]